MQDKIFDHHITSASFGKFLVIMMVKVIILYKNTIKWSNFIHFRTILSKMDYRSGVRVHTGKKILKFFCIFA